MRIYILINAFLLFTNTFYGQIDASMKCDTSFTELRDGLKKMTLRCGGKILQEGTFNKDKSDNL